jgi:hypothetical protein
MEAILLQQAIGAQKTAGVPKAQAIVMAAKALSAIGVTYAEQLDAASRLRSGRARLIAAWDWVTRSAGRQGRPLGSPRP